MSGKGDEDGRGGLRRMSKLRASGKSGVEAVIRTPNSHLVIFFWKEEKKKALTFTRCGKVTATA